MLPAADIAGRAVGTTTTVDLTRHWGAVVNQKRGHCAKMSAILKEFRRMCAEDGHCAAVWVIADDDTMFSVPRLLRMLGTLDVARPLYIGERYGWGQAGEQFGYDYITMGGGVAFTQSMLDALLDCEACVCTRPDEPDDMRLGHWVGKEFNMTVMHTPLFHQAEITQYHPSRIAAEGEVVSFHKFASRDAGGGIWVPDVRKMQELHASILGGPPPAAAAAAAKRDEL